MSKVCEALTMFSISLTKWYLQKYLPCQNLFELHIHHFCFLFICCTEIFFKKVKKNKGGKEKSDGSHKKVEKDKIRWGKVKSFLLLFPFPLGM